MVSLKSGSRTPWVGLGASVWLQMASGNAFTFPLYSHSLKSVLGFNQSQVTMLGVANDIGENVGIVPGIACNKFPPWVVLLVGALASFFGYGVLWLAVSRTVESLPYWLVSSDSSCRYVYCMHLHTEVPPPSHRGAPTRVRRKVHHFASCRGSISHPLCTQLKRSPPLIKSRAKEARFDGGAPVAVQLFKISFASFH
ncbi:hypothetical protein Acr_01g0005770 [Actinidia rufa]|uniref:Nodulin-like domain-containing protein n=1 Tax=Actinidia rufa TaxID=165716 RepID=A0A7J0E2W8_9ERIC|nr:hypothetical protein Acr_01g0005770 [Actinidia rufa]